MDNNEKIVINEATNDKTKKSKKSLIIICGVFLTIIVAVVLVLNLVCFHEWQEATGTTPMTCSKCGKTEGEPLNEDDFLRDLAKGLEDRWVLADSANTLTATKENWEGYFDAEYNAIIKYKKSAFKDKTMSDLAEKYVECIVETKACLPNFGTNQWSSKYNDVYQDREILLYKIDSVKPIPVSDESRTAFLEPMLTEGETLSIIKKMLKTVEFKKVVDDWSWVTYETVVENTAPINFNYFTFEIALIDKDGVTLSTEYASVNNWDSGEKAKFSFWTDEKFAEMKVERASWDY
ncbi:MAG: FxLYD domain-containing protein [Clostridia bacterium]|nr:FxLYD domain-containing protein [Clostridia bacterium]